MGTSSSSKGNSNSSNRGRAYGVMLLLAFGAAVLGVMVLHKLRERRIFNLLIKEKDHDLISLHLLLQKERNSNKEANIKIEGLEAKTYSLRSQKMELSRRIMEMQSVTDSLKEEQRALESALEEKQNEIEMQKKNEVDSSKENPQITALTELLKQKETEIEDLKHHLKNLVNIRSVSTDDRLNQHINLTATGKHEAGESEEGEISDVKQLQESGNPKDGEISTARREYDNKNGTEGIDHREMPKPRELQLKNQGSSQEGQAFGKRTKAGENSTDEGQQEGEVIGSEKTEKPEESQDHNNRIETEISGNSSDKKSLKTGDDGKEFEIIRAGQLRHHENSQDGESRQLGKITKGGVKLENDGGLEIRDDGVGSKQKGTRRRIISKNKEPEKTGKSRKDAGISMRRRRFYQGELEKTESRRGHKTGLGIRDELDREGSIAGHGKEERMLEKNEISTYAEGDNKVELGGKRRGATKNEERPKMAEGFGESEGLRVRDEKDDQNTLDVSKQVASSDSQLQRPENPEDLRIRNSDSKQQMGKENEIVSTGEQLGNHQDEERLTTRIVDDDASEFATNAMEQKQDEIISQSGNQEARNVKQREDGRSMDNINIDSTEETRDDDNINIDSTEETTRDGEGDEETEDLEVGKMRESGRHKGGSVISERV